MLSWVRGEFGSTTLAAEIKRPARMVVGESRRRIDGHTADGIDEAACDVGHVIHFAESISCWRLRGG